MGRVVSRCCLFLACFGLLQSQGAAQIPNAGFETWVGDSVLTGWFTSNIPGFFKNVSRVATPHSGTYAVQGTVIRSVVPGTFYSAVMQSGPSGEGFSINLRPGALHGWYRFISDSGDGLNVITAFEKNGIGIGVGTLAILGTQSTYREFVVNTLWVTGETPDTAIINIAIVTGGGSSRTHFGTTFIVDDLSWGAASDVKEIGTGVPGTFALEQNYPNPFNPMTRIQFQIPESRFVTLRVYNMLGQEVALLVNEEMPAGRFRAELDASNLPSGSYFYRLQAGEFSQTKKLIVVK